ncbi:MAG: 2-phospho-L-lactate guanylyltransferase [Pseudorhodoplanes sp.]
MISSAPKRAIWAVLPAKRLAQAKTRLAGCLSLAERQMLARVMLEDVLAALEQCPHLGGILLVTADPDLRDIGARAGADILDDDDRDGQTSSVAAAAATLAEREEAGLLAISGDIPLVTPAEIAEVIIHTQSERSITLVPAPADMGTNILALRPLGAIDFRFGVRSFFEHRKRALEQAIMPTILHLRGAGLDLDRPQDLLAFMKTPSNTRTYSFLTGLGLIERLGGSGHESRKIL